jgi:hypothetical protein
MMKNDFVGTWRLESWENRREGETTYPFGQDAIGYITYTEEGYMSVAFMTSNRSNYTSGDFLGGSKEEKAAAAETHASYCGTYKIQGNTIIHSIEVSSFPNWVGTDQERFFEVEDKILTLSTAPILLAGKQQTAHLIWERA